MLNKPRTLLLTVIIASLLAPSLVSASPKLAVVDLQKVIRSTKAGRAAKAKFEALHKKKKKQMQRRDNQLKAQEKALGKQKVALGRELANINPKKITPLLRAKAQEFEAKVRRFQQEIIAFQKTRQTILQQLAKKEVALLKPIEDKIKGHISTIAKQRGFTMVLNRMMVVYNIPSVDITNEVSRRMGK